MKKTVLGIEKRTSKSGTSYFMLHVSCPLSPENGTGVSVSSEYVKADLMPEGVKVGSEVIFIYEKGFGDKAFLSGISVVK